MSVYVVWINNKLIYLIDVWTLWFASLKNQDCLLYNFTLEVY